MTVPGEAAADAVPTLTLPLARKFMEPPPSVVTVPTVKLFPDVIFNSVLAALAVISPVAVILPLVEVTLIWLPKPLAVRAPTMETSLPAVILIWAPAVLAVIAALMLTSCPAFNVKS